MINNTVTVKPHQETLFVLWEVKNFTDHGWNAFCFLPGSDSRRFYLTLKESDNQMLTIYFSSQHGDVQCWGTKVFVKSRNGNSWFLQTNTVAGNSFNRYEIWKLHKSALSNTRQEFLVNGSITFGVYLKDLNVLALYKDSIGSKSIQTTRKKDDLPCLNSLSLDFCNLLESGANSDVILKSGNTEFPVHKAVMSSRSEVFSAMFRSGMKESNDGLVEIEDINASDLRQFLKYIYGGKVDELSEESAKRLYVIADMYAVESLKKKCAAFLAEILTDSNACGILLLADTHNDSDFKTSVIQFIIRKKRILHSEEWSQISDERPKLGVEVFKAHLRKPSTSQVETVYQLNIRQRLENDWNSFIRKYEFSWLWNFFFIILIILVIYK